MKIIVLHDKYSNDPIIVSIEAITAIKKMIDVDSMEEFSSVNISQIFFDVKEHMDVIMKKINNVERRWQLDQDNISDRV